MVRFSSTIYKLGINPVVDPPDDVLDAIFDQAGRATGPIQVRGKLNGAVFIQTLVKYSGKWRLYINGQMLVDSGLSVGDIAGVEIEFDPQPRDVPVPPRLDSALRKDARAKAEFERLSPSRRKEICRYIGSLKTRESIDRNVGRIIGDLRGDKVDRPHVVVRRKRSRSG